MPMYKGARLQTEVCHLLQWTELPEIASWMPVWLVKTTEIIFLRKSSNLAWKQFSQECTVMTGITRDKEHQQSGVSFYGKHSSI